MSAWPWLLGAFLCGTWAVLLGRPALGAMRGRRRRDLNAERYLAWRGRADRSPAGQGITAVERRRLWFAGTLGVAALLFLAAFLTSA